MRTKYILFNLTIFLLMLSCSQKTSNQSRQFGKTLNLGAITSDNETIAISLRCWYEFTSNSNKTFDEKGMFINEDQNIDQFLNPVVYSAVRNVIGKYSSKDLYLAEKRNVENEIYLQVKNTESNAIYGLKIQFNALLLGEIEYPHIINQAKNSDLLNEYDLLKSENPDERLKAIKKLLNEGNTTSYSIILEHWANEKDIENRAFILKQLSKSK